MAPVRRYFSVEIKIEDRTKKCGFWVNLRSCFLVNLWNCVCIFIIICIWDVYIYIYMYMYVCDICTYIYICIYVIYVHIYIYVYIYIRTICEICIWWTYLCPTWWSCRGSGPFKTVESTSTSHGTKLLPPVLTWFEWNTHVGEARGNHSQFKHQIWVV